MKVGEKTRAFRATRIRLSSVLVAGCILGINLWGEVAIADSHAHYSAAEIAAVENLLLEYDELVRELEVAPAAGFDLSVSMEAFQPSPGSGRGPNPSRPDLDDLFNDEPIHKPNPSGPGGGSGGSFIPGLNPGMPSGGGIGGSNSLGSRQGAAFLIAMKTLYQTLNFYGVKHYVEKTPSTIEFRIIESKSGYFLNLNRFDVAFALREFARFLTAHLCNDPSVDNFAKAFSQVSDEEIGFRFKYDMAWALLGNLLPRNPNPTFVIGTRWAALGRLINSTRSIQANSEEGKELQRWSIVINDVMNILQQLNQLMCFVDIRPKVRDEIRKRVVVTKLLEMDRDLQQTYGDLKALVDDATRAGQREKLDFLNSSSSSSLSDED